MTTSLNHACALILAVAACAAPLRGAEESPALTPQGTVAMPGVEGRLDHATIDAATHRLFFAALGNNTLEILDVNEGGKRLHTIPGLKNPTGVVFVNTLNVLVVASGGDGTCRFYDGTTYAEKGRITDLDDADNVRFDAHTGRVYLGYGKGGLAVIDPAAMKVTARIPLPRHPESFQLEEAGPRIFVNIPEARQIAVVDRQAGKVVATWPVEEAHANFPMALDEKHHRLFIGCRQPARLLVYDTKGGQRIASAEMSGDTDDLFLDVTANRLLASCGEGFVDVFRVEPLTQLARVQRMASASGARTSQFNAARGVFYLAVPHRGSQKAGIRSYLLSPTP